MRIMDALRLGVMVSTVFNADIMRSQHLFQQLFGIRNYLLVLYNEQQLSEYVRAS